MVSPVVTIDEKDVFGSLRLFHGLHPQPGTLFNPLQRLYTYTSVECVESAPRARATFERDDLGGEILCVDEGSTDGTAVLVEKAAGGWSLLKVLRHPTNLGKTEAIITAARSTERTYLVLFDADLQHLPDQIPRFLEKLHEGWDILTGRKIGFYDKRGVSSVNNALSRRIFRVPV